MNPKVKLTTGRYQLIYDGALAGSPVSVRFFLYGPADAQWTVLGVWDDDPYTGLDDRTSRRLRAAIATATLDELDRLFEDRSLPDHHRLEFEFDSDTHPYIPRLMRGGSQVASPEARSTVREWVIEPSPAERRQNGRRAPGGKQQRNRGGRRRNRGDRQTRGR